MDYGVIGEMAVKVRLPYIDSHLTATGMQPTNALCTSSRAINLLRSQPQSERKANKTLLVAKRSRRLLIFKIVGS